MAANRSVILLAGLLGLVSLPACLSIGYKEPLPATVQVEPAVGSDFARLRSPGERVALRDADPTETPDPPRALPTNPGSPAVLGTDFRPPAEPMPIPIPTPIASGPPPFDSPLVAAVRAYLDNRPDLALEYLKQFDPQNQELLLQLIPAIVKASQTNLEKAGPHDLAVLVSQLESAAAGLSGKVPLMVDKACFVRDIRAFGRYDPLPEGHVFKAQARAELYAEVRNVPTEPVTLPTGVGGFITKLICTLEVHDAAGNVVELPDETGKLVPIQKDTKRDFSRSPVRDYFLLFRFPVPSKPGTYKVTFGIHDPANGRAVSRIMAFRVQ